MEYSDFKREFVLRTLAIINSYSKEYEATLLLNCLLGLIVLPHELLERMIPDDPIKNLPQWGIRQEEVSLGRCGCDETYPKTVRQFVQLLRNAVAHFDITPRHENGIVSGFIFIGRRGFVADISLHSLRMFVTRLSESLKQQPERV